MDVKNLIDNSKKKLLQVYDFVNDGATDLNLTEKIILSSAIWLTYNKNGLGTNADWIAGNIGCTNAEASQAIHRLLGLGYLKTTRKEGANWDTYMVDLETMENLTKSK